MTHTLVLRIEGTSTLEEHGTKPDGTPDVRVKRFFKLRLEKDYALILWEEELPREKVPVDPSRFLTERIAALLKTYLPGIDPRA